MKTIPYYDDEDFDYQKYWIGREYENRSEKIVLAKIFQYINEIKPTRSSSLLDVGSGFGRLADIYLNLVESSTLLEPSQKLSEIASKRLKRNSSSKIVNSTIEDAVFKNNAFDIILLVRVIHHLESVEGILRKLYGLVKPGGFLILEFANKGNFKGRLGLLVKSFIGKGMADKEESKVDRRSPGKVASGSIAFYNYDPGLINSLLAKSGFLVRKRYSVSNFRSGLLKKIIPTNWLLFFEKALQAPLANLDFGPSIFIVAQKEASGN